MTATALIVDDEPDIRQLIALSLERIGLDTHTAANLSEARHLLETYAFDVCLTDMRLPDGNGLELVRHVQETCPALPIAVITAHGNMEAAVEAMKDGAFDFVSKPVDVKRLRTIVTQAIERGGTAANDTGTGSGPGASLSSAASSAASSSTPDSRSSSTSTSATIAAGAPTDASAATSAPPVPESVASTSPSSGDSLESLSGQCAAGPVDDALVGGERLIGRSAAMQELRRLIRKVARTNAPVWITGESGTGKELIARLIHENGPRGTHPFVAINCGAIPAELMESELFGHRKGSFTGAVTDSEGLFRRAEGGTLFLDEVAELPLHMQVKLLRAIQERSVRPVGGTEEVAVDARVLSASHKDLAGEVDDGRFRHDLYYRLNVISIRSPSLRDREGDIVELARHVLGRLAKDDGRTASLSPSAMARLEGYRFPGNVRELENLLERAVAMSEGALIDADDLVLRPDDAATGQVHGMSSDTADGTTDGRADGRADGMSERRAVGTSPEDAERRRLIAALEARRWNRKAAAADVGLTYRQFRYRLSQLGIDGPGGR